MDSAVASLFSTPETSFLREEAKEARGKCLVLREKQMNDEEFAAMLKSLVSDQYFQAVDVAGNCITDRGAEMIAEVIDRGATVLTSLHLENNAITDKGGSVLLGSKTLAFQRHQRNWLIFTRGNPMAQELILSLQTPIVDLARSASREFRDSFLSVAGPSPIPALQLDKAPSDIGEESSEHFNGVLTDLTESQRNPEVLDLRNSGLSAVPEDLEVLSSLKRLALGDNSIAAVEHLPQYLDALELRNNALTAISGLEILASLLYLDLSSNRITAISGLGQNFALREVSLAHNLIAEVAGLEHLRGLRKLHLGNNRIATFLSIRTISMNTALRVLVLMGNPICQQAKYKVAISSLLPKLCILDNVPLSSYRGESFSKTQQRTGFFSIDFTEVVIDSARTKVTPRFPLKSSPTLSSHGSLFSDLQTEQGEPLCFPSPSSTLSKGKPPPKKTSKRSTKKPKPTATPPPLPQAEKPPSVQSTFYAPEEPVTSVPLSEEEKEATKKHLRALVLFRGLEDGFFKALLGSVQKGRARKGDVLQDGSLLVSRLLLVLKGRVQWKNLLHGPWTAFYLESLISPQEAEDHIICVEFTEFISFDREVVMEALEAVPEAKQGFYANYDRLQTAREQQILTGLDSMSSDVSKRTPSSIMRQSSTSRSGFLPKASFQALTKPDHSRTIAFSTVSSDPRSQRIQADIQKLLATDPFRPESDPVLVLPPVDSYSDWREAVTTMRSHVSELFTFHSNESASESAHQSLLAEAEEFSVNGPLKTYEFLALSRADLRQCVDQAFLLPSQSISEIAGEGLLDEYASLLAAGDEEDQKKEALKGKLQAWREDLEGETQSCMAALSNILLYGKDESLVLARLAEDREVSTKEDLAVFLRNPKRYLARMHIPNDAETGGKAIAVVAASGRNAYCKQALERLLAAVNTRDEAVVERIKGELVAEGVLTFSLAPCKTYAKGEKREMEIRTRADLRQSEAVEADSAVSSGVASAR